MMKSLTSKKGNAGKIVSAVIAILIAVVVIPIALVQITASEGNFTATQVVLLSLVGLFLVLAVVVLAAKAAGFNIVGGK